MNRYMDGYIDNEKQICITVLTNRLKRVKIKLNGAQHFLFYHRSFAADSKCLANFLNLFGYFSKHTHVCASMCTLIYAQTS